MKRDVKHKKAADNEVDSDHEIWSAIRYLDPDLGFKKSDIVFDAIWIILILLVCVVIFRLYP